MMKMVHAALIVIGLFLAMRSDPSVASPIDVGGAPRIDATQAGDASSWRLIDHPEPLLVFSRGGSRPFDFAISCRTGTGEGHFRANLWFEAPPGALMTTPQMRINELVQIQFASGPIIRQYSLRRVYSAEKAAITDEMDARFQTDDPLWQEFARSGRLSFVERPIDAKTAEERTTIRTFMDGCRRRFPLEASGPLVSIPTNPESDGYFAYPFTPVTLVGLPALALLLIGAIAVGGRRAASTGLWGGIIAAAIFTAITSGPYAATLENTWTLKFNEIFVPAASVFGQLTAAWLLLGGAAALLALGSRELARWMSDRSKAKNSQ